MQLGTFFSAFSRFACHSLARFRDDFKTKKFTPILNVLHIRLHKLTCLSTRRSVMHLIVQELVLSVLIQTVFRLIKLSESHWCKLNKIHPFFKQGNQTSKKQLAICITFFFVSNVITLILILTEWILFKQMPALMANDRFVTALMSSKSAALISC